ncbi:MAG: EipB family protein [Pseudomonadota bacterium]
MRAAILVVLAALLAPGIAGAQMQPHRAEYSLRLGTALNAPRIGTAVQDISLDCTGWHIRRDVSVDVAFTPSFKIGIASRMEGEEERDGSGFSYRTVQVLNGTERETRGEVQRKDGADSVELTTPEGAERVLLPAFTLMPVAAVNYALGRLGKGASTFPVLAFGAEATGAAFLIDVKQSEPGSTGARPPSAKRVDLPAARWWPLAMTVSRPDQPHAKPLLSLAGRLFENGILDRLTIDAGVFTVAAYLQDLQMREAPSCPGR